MFKITKGSLTRNWEILIPMFREHYKEVHLFPDAIPFNPSYETYEKLEELGFIETYFVRHQNEIVGYAVYMVNNNPHYYDHVYAVNDVLFVSPEHRNTGVADELIQYAEKCLVNSRKASVITYHMKLYKPFRSLMARNGYSIGEESYVKCLVEK